ncbi:MAG: ribonuclease D [Hyphomicrobium zavarzinii]|jgi:ribonuclease D|uniref:ribonuclease D n=1 Tax=Hyphomicrobium TaxID=81 RepID=UPI0003737743|nr:MULTISPECIES: ribonuclease D [Hyphomicrobium]MBL8844204.1 ribonuclease D [Hyphomicrobium zavarzinii]WBT39503.1 ribonuclease D [Hyphomicrobium sp. DMF-1]HML44592.1 ribonuclease D [Hyphomicrobium zavarzinii]
MRVITSTSALSETCSRLAAGDFVAVDTEFMREQTFWPDLCLIQLAGPGDEVIVDPLAEGLDLKPFYDLMADEKVVKVFHAARQDIEIVFSEAGLIPAPVFDTQIAAMVCGFGESVSYVNLVKKITGRDLDKSSRFTDWSRRPLTEKQLVYAIGDVTHLRDIYTHLKTELEVTNRESWLDEEMAELTAPSTYESHPENAWQRLKMRVKNRKALAVLIELAAWRERLAQAQDVPRGRILRDEALYDIANQQPTSPEKLSELRTLSDGFSRSQRAKEIVDAVKRGLERDPKTVPALPHSQPMSAEATATIELLKVLLKASAARHRVAPRLIADADDLERIASEKDPDVPALKGWRRQLFGEDALKLKRGELALTLAKGEVLAIGLPEES